MLNHSHSRWVQHRFLSSLQHIVTHVSERKIADIRRFFMTQVHRCFAVWFDHSDLSILAASVAFIHASACNEFAFSSHCNICIDNHLASTDISNHSCKSSTSKLRYQHNWASRTSWDIKFNSMRSRQWLWLNLAHAEQIINDLNSWNASWLEMIISHAYTACM